MAETTDSADDIVIAPATQEEILAAEAQNASQMELFASAVSSDQSNSIHLYDTAPKYNYTKRKRHVTESAFDRRKMTIAKIDYEVEVQAARIEVDGTEVLMPPSEREEHIEDALRKLATSGNGVFINGEAGVKFTLYELQKELSKHGHTYDWGQLREGLYIMRRSGLKLTNKMTGESWEENFLSRLVEGGRRKNQDGTSYEPWYAGFHKLVTKSINDMTYRQINYPLLMSIKGLLAKYIFKRMVAVYTYANLERPYEPTLVQILEESGRGLSDEMKNNIKAVRRAFDQLIERGVLIKVEETERHKQGNKVINIRFALYPTESFVSDVISANAKQKEIKAKHGQRELARIKAGLEN